MGVCFDVHSFIPLSLINTQWLPNCDEKKTYNDMFSVSQRYQPLRPGVTLDKALHETGLPKLCRFKLIQLLAFSIKN